MDIMQTQEGRLGRRARIFRARGSRVLLRLNGQLQINKKIAETCNKVVISSDQYVKGAPGVRRVSGNVSNVPCASAIEVAANSLSSQRVNKNHGSLGWLARKQK